MRDKSYHTSSTSTTTTIHARLNAARLNLTTSPSLLVKLLRGAAHNDARRIHAWGFTTPVRALHAPSIQKQVNKYDIQTGHWSPQGLNSPSSYHSYCPYWHYSSCL